MSLLQVIDGSETFVAPNCHIKISTFFFTQMGKAIRSREVFGLLKVTGEQPDELIPRSSESTMASSKNANHGRWTTSTFAIRSKQYGCVEIEERQASPMPRRRVMYFEASDEAPYTSLTVGLTGHPDAVQKQLIMEGRFRLLTDAELRKLATGDAAGVLTISNFLANYTNYLDDTGGIKVRTKEIEPARRKVVDSTKKIVTETGNEITVTRNRIRRINTSK